MSSTYHDSAAAAVNRSCRADARHQPVARRVPLRDGRTSSKPRGVPRVETVLVLMVVAALAVAALASGPANVVPDRTTMIRVRTGESLWSVARSHPVAGLSTAQTVQLLVELNRLEGPALIAGTDIRVPSEQNSQIAAR